MLTSSVYGSAVRNGTLHGSAWRRRGGGGDVANRRAPSPLHAISSPPPASEEKTRPSPTSTSSSSSFRTPGSPVAAPATPLLLQLLIEALLSFPPVFDSAVRAARAKIARRGLDVGVDIEAYAAELRRARDWAAALREVEDAALAYPAYYLEPFHCYETGNLNWEAALEGPASSKAVHAPVMDDSADQKLVVLDPRGDEMLRRSHSSTAARLIAEAFQEMAAAAAGPSSDSGSPPPPAPPPTPFDFGAVGLVVDLGCSVGLSTRELGRVFPNARLVGVDLSPHMLAVFDHLQSLSDSEAKRNPIPEAAGGIEPNARRARLLHAAAEETGLESGSADVVSLHLVMHELPQAATRAILKEAFRILKPGGVVVLGEMDPGSAAFGRVLKSPFAFAAFRSSEPHLLEYITLDVPAAAREAGFAGVRTAAHSPRHFTLVGVKPPPLA